MCNFTPTTLADPPPPDDTRTAQAGPVFVTADARGYSVSIFPHEFGADVPADCDPLTFAGELAAVTLEDLAREIREATK